jgi:hypothetical protein
VIFSHPSFAGKIGFAQSDITPPVGIYARNWGAANHDAAKGIHRPLHARVLSLQSDDCKNPILLISLDLGWWKTREDEWFVRGALLEEFDLDESRVLINLTHTHAGPVFCREDSDKPGGEFIAPYLQKVRDAVLDAARRAEAGSTPATLAWAFGKCTLARNRDLPDPQRERILCGFNPDAPADDTLLVGRATENETGKTICVLANYACHPTTLAWDNKLISPDWLGAFYETIANQTNAPALFLQGASGELQPRETFIGDTKIADAQGKQFAFAVLSTLAGMLPPNTVLEYSGAVESGAPLAIWQRMLHEQNTHLSAKRIEIEMPLKDDLESAAQLQSALDNCEDRMLRERLTRKMRVRRTVGDGGSTRLPVWIWEVGDAIFIAHREEAYSVFQKELRAQFPDKAIIVMNLTNGSCGYLPPNGLYDLDMYQVWQTPYARGAAEILRDAVGREIQF